MTPRHCIPLAARAATVLTAVAAMAIAALGLAATPALADDCPNAALRAQNNSTQLPDCRAYELVTNPFKEGFLPSQVGYTENGRVAYVVAGNFANNGLGSGTNNLYVADRSSSGWSTTPQFPSGPEYNISGFNSFIMSSDLGSSLWIMSRAEEPIGVGDLYRGRSGLFTRVGPATDPDLIPPSAPGGTAVPPFLNNIGVSEDLSHVVIVSDFGVAGGGPSGDLYEYVGTGNDRPRLVDADNAGQRISSCGVVDGAYNTSRLDPSQYHAVSTDGHAIFWTARCPAPAVWARIDGTTTIKVSSSDCTRASGDPGGVCNAATVPPLFQGANAAGTRVFFTTSQQLVDNDTDATQDLYECDIPTSAPEPVGPTNPCPSLHEVSGAASGADVQGVTRISDDGSRVYFVATGVLASNHGADDVTAAAGDHNLYVWERDSAHPDGETTFVGKLDPSDGDLWGPDNAPGRAAQTTDDGRYLIFVSRAALIDSGPQADTDAAADVYHYDADTGTLKRLSTDVDGRGGNEPGRDAQFHPVIYQHVRATTRPREAMTDDGRAAIFFTDEALSPADTNGGYDVYMWRDGHVSLISSGRPTSDALVDLGTLTASISSSGRDVYFATTAQLTANDVDTQLDIYDARVDGGFDLSSSPGCVGDACQGERSAPAPLSQASPSKGEDVLPPSTPAFSVRALTATQRKRVALTGKMSLSVTTNAPGMLSAVASASIAKRSSTVGSAKYRVSKAGTVSLSLTLSRRARAELKSKGKLTVKVEMRQDNVAIPRTVSFKLIRAKAAKKKTSRAMVRGRRS